MNWYSIINCQYDGITPLYYYYYYVTNYYVRTYDTLVSGTEFYSDLCVSGGVHWHVYQLHTSVVLPLFSNFHNLNRY